MIEKLTDVTADEYMRLFPAPSTAFGSAQFNILNAAKAEEIRFVAGFDAACRPLIGLIAGLRNGVWRSPFSAPMAALSWNSEVSLATIADFFTRIKAHFAPNHIRLVLPPYFVAPNMLAKISGIAINMSSEMNVDYNYHYLLDNMTDFKRHMKPSARNKYNRAMKENFTFETTDIARAYNVIRINRSSKGYYLAMSLDDVEATAQTIQIDSFVLRQADTDVAAAIVYRITPDIAHVVYWGDVPGFENKRPMNLLPYHIFSFYREQGFRIVNIGTSSTDGVPNHGLCDYKESIGCTASLIPTCII